MDRAATLAAVREKYPQYNDMSDDQLGNALADKYPKQYGDLRPAKHDQPQRPTAIEPTDLQQFADAAMMPWKQGDSVRQKIQDKYGGREEFMKMYDPKYGWVERNLVPPALGMVVAGGAGALAAESPVLAGAISKAEPALSKYVLPGLEKGLAKTGEAIEKIEPAVKRLLTEDALKKALEALGIGTIGYQAGKRVFGGGGGKE